MRYGMLSSPMDSNKVISIGEYNDLYPVDICEDWLDFATVHCELLINTDTHIIFKGVTRQFTR